MDYLFMGILIGIAITQYIFPVFNTLLDLYTLKSSEIATKYQIKAETLAKEFELKYGENHTQAIGFHMADENVEYDEDDDEEIEEKSRNKIGF